jgi:WD40 repeat protein
MNRCPPTERLRLLLGDALAGTEHEEVAAHLEECADCQREMELLLAATAIPPDRPAGDDPQPRPEFLSRLKRMYCPPDDTEPRAEVPPAWPAVPGYEVVGVLGRGATAVVYKARQRGLNRTVALKMIVGGEYATPSELSRFRAEAEVVARLQHPNIVQIHEVGEHGGLPYFSLEFCPGGTLAQRLNGPPLGPTPAAELVEVLARAVHHAHQNGVVHRDLKPANVLLAAGDPAGDTGQQAMSWVPRIADFGLARRLDVTGPTATGAVLGTPSYMAPEQAQGRTHEVGPATDVYALGAILYELLAGRPPFRAAHPLDTMLLVVSQDALPPRAFEPRLPRDLETVCLKCLHKEPQRRYASAQDLADDLRRFLRGEPVRARRVGAAGRTWRWCRRNPLSAALTAAVLGLLLVAATGASLAAVLLGRQRDEALGHLGRAERAERDATEKLLRTTFARAQATRRGNQVGQRFDSLRALQEAADIARSQGVFDEYALDLRNAAIGSLALADLRVLDEWDAPPRWRDSFESPVAFSADLGRYAFADPQGVVTVVRADGGAEVARLRAPDGKVGGVVLAFGAAGRLLAASYWIDNSRSLLILWEVVDGEEPRQVRRYDGGWFAFGPDDRQVAVGRPDGSIDVDDLAGGGRRNLGPGHHPSWMAFRPDGRQLAFINYREQDVVQVLDLETGTVLRRLGHPDDVGSLAWSADGRLLAAGCDDRNIHVWEAEGWQEQAVLEGHQAQVTALAFSPAGELLVSHGLDGTTRLWDPVAGRPLLVAEGRPLRFGADGRRLAFRRWQRVGVWEVADGRECRTLHHGRVGNRAPWLAAKGPEAVGFSPDGRLLLSTARDGVRLWDASDGRELAHLNAGHHEAAFFHPDGTLYTFGRTGLRSWPVGPDGGIPGTLRVGPPRLLVAREGQGWFRGCVSADGRLVAAAYHRDDHEDCVIVFPAARPEERTVLADGVRKVTGLAMSPDGRRVAVGLFDQERGVKFWDVRERRLEWHDPGHCCQVAFSRDGHWLVAGRDTEYRTWEVGSWAPGPTIPRDRAAMVPGGPAFGPDDRVTAVASSAQEIKLLDSLTRREVATLAPPDLPFVGRMCFSPDGGLLAVATESHAVKLWDLRAIARRLREMGLGHDLLPGEGSAPAGPPIPRARVFQDVYEAENLKVVAAGGCAHQVQDLKPWGRENWSNGKHLWCRSAKGGFVEFAVDLPQTGRYHLDVHFTKSGSYGRVETWLDGVKVGPVFDGYHPTMAPPERVAYGTFALRAGRHRLRFSAAERDPRSAGYEMGIDCLGMALLDPPSPER